MTINPASEPWHWMGGVGQLALVSLSVSGACMFLLGRGASAERLARLPTWARWLLVLPAANIAALVAELAAKVPIVAVEVAVNHELVTAPGVYSIAWRLWAPIFFVVGAVWLAPSRRLWVFGIFAAIKGGVGGRDLFSDWSFVRSGGSWNAVDTLTYSPLWWNDLTIALFLVLLICMGWEQVTAQREGRAGALAFGDAPESLAGSSPVEPQSPTP